MMRSSTLRLELLAGLDTPARIALAAGLLLAATAVGAAFGLAAALATTLVLTGAVLALVMPRPRVARIEAQAVQKARPPEFAALIDVLDDPILIVDGDRVVEANPAARTLLGSHIIGQSVRSALRDPAATEMLARPEKCDPVEISGLGRRDLHWEMRALTMADGRRVINLIDRSQRHSLDRARTDFVANASHELRTPLAAILGFVETLTDDQAGGDAPTRVRFLGVIQSEARRMQNLVEDLMSLSRIEADKHQRPTAVVDFGALARQAVDELRDAEGLRRDNIALAIASDLPSVLGDRAQLLQVVHNLLDNALKYGRTNGQVTAALVRVGNDRIRLSVVDQGDGIAPEHLPRLTERFYRVDPGRSRAGGGTGLGLAIVKHIVERHRGVLEIASTVGTGTTVTVMLPVAPGAAHGSAAFDLRQ